MIRCESAVVDCASTSIIEIAREIKKRESIRFFMIGLPLLLDPEYLADAARDAVVCDVDRAVASDRDPARSSQHAGCNFGSCTVRCDADQRTCPVTFNKSGEQTVLRQFENVHGSV